MKMPLKFVVLGLLAAYYVYAFPLAWACLGLLTFVGLMPWLSSIQRNIWSENLARVVMYALMSLLALYGGMNLLFTFLLPYLLGCWLWAYSHQGSSGLLSVLAWEGWTSLAMLLGMLFFVQKLLIPAHGQIPALDVWSSRLFLAYLLLTFGLWCLRARWPLAWRVLWTRGFYYVVLLWVLAIYGVEALLLVAVVLAFIGMMLRPWYPKAIGVSLAEENIYFLVLFWLVRSFVAQPFVVPTGSLEPSVQPGDFVLVNQYVYGLRMPVFGGLLWPINLPKRGDIAVFRYPPQPNMLYVKRVIGLPGDHIIYHRDELTINGEKIKRVCDHKIHTQDVPVQEIEHCIEHLPGMTHDILISDQDPHRLHHWEWTIPKGYYLMLGDNRRASYDSRFWGLVPEELLVGRVDYILFGVAQSQDLARLNRVLQRVPHARG